MCPQRVRDEDDEELKSEIERVHRENFAIYGVVKAWKQLQREGHSVARRTVRRLMRDLELQGVRRGRKFKRTTCSDDQLHRPSELVDRQFVSSAPNRLWVADLTYVKTAGIQAHSGWVYVAFVVDVFPRAVVGWQVSNSLRSDLATDALEMAIFARGDRDLSELVHHSDRGVQYLGIRYSERLGEAGVVASVGSRGDSYDNGLAESFNGLFKTELIHRQGPWRNVEHIEWATLNYVDWFNRRRLHGEIGLVPPAEFEARYYDSHESESLAGLEGILSSQNPA